MTPLQHLGYFALDISFAALCAAIFYKIGYSHGWRDSNRSAEDAYESGKKDADDWWIGAESAVERTRQAMWKKGANQ